MIPALGRGKELEFESSLGYMTPCLPKKKAKNKQTATIRCAPVVRRQRQVACWAPETSRAI